MNTRFQILSMGVCFSALPLMADTNHNEKPNIVWFLTEDLSTHYLALYNNGNGAETPNVLWMAQNGVTYTNAYSNAPVSSAARTTLITGCYAPRFAGSFHRRLQNMTMPEGLRMFPSYLKEAGYYTCNAQKTDYNVKLDKTAWDNIKGELDSWKDRADKSQPFFFQRSNMLTHESKLQFDEETYSSVKTVHDPSKVYLHPSLPDTELIRYTYATFYDRIHDSDEELGKLISMLKEEGVLDNTIIFYFGDNGGSLPGTKGYTDDIGIHVPLVVYVPEKWREKLGIEKGCIADEPVSFMDFAPTVLKLVGVEVPEQMDGQPFLGEEKKEDFIVGYGDRFDELYAFNRTLRKGKYRYARNYQPYHTQSLFALYRYKQLSFREWKDMFVYGKLNENQSSFFMPFGPEELYDLEKDPYEMNNLANDKKYKNVLAEMRNELNAYLVKKADLGFFPETVVLEEGMANPATWGSNNRGRIKKFADIAQLQTEKYSAKVEDMLKKSLQSDDAVERMWALTTCSYFAKKASALKQYAEKLLTDERSFVRSRAMVFLSELGESFSKDDVLAVLGNVKTGAETMYILNDLTHMFENNLISPFKIKKDELKKKCSGVDWRVKYLNSYASSDSWEERWKLIYKENGKR